MSDLKPSEIVKELDKYIIGQKKRKTICRHRFEKPMETAESPGVFAG